MFGVLPVNKPPGITSRDVVNQVARLIRPTRVGHTGTLDPMATGVLLLAVGPATRLVEFSHMETKEYAAQFWLGSSSDTLDAEGVVQSIDDAPTITAAQIDAELPRWLGDIQQTPPRYSAVNIDGQRAYTLARKGKDFSLPSRTVRIEELELTSFDGRSFGLRIVCGTGTYIRTLGSDIARALGSDAVMHQLARTRIGHIKIEQCVALDALGDGDIISQHLQPAQAMLSSMKHVVLDGQHARQIRSGIPIELASDTMKGETAKPAANSGAVTADIGAESGPVLAIDSEQQIVAILERSGRRYRSLRVFHTTSDTNQPTSTSKPHKPES
jgi:tRNA pseudouridine55 synthase